MDDAAQAEAYAGADFAAPNAAFCAMAVERGLVPERGRVADLGCGPADIPLRLAVEHPGLSIDAVDGSAAMLAHARAAVDAAGVADRVTLIHARLPAPSLPSGRYALVASNSLLHHLHAPELLWSEVARLCQPGGAVLVMDLRRPPSEAAARALVAQYAADEPPVLRHDFLASLLAAFEPAEVREQLDRAGLETLAVEPVGDRHLIVHGRL